MIVKGYIFYKSIDEPVPIPQVDFAEDYSSMSELIQTFTELVDNSENDPQLDMCGFLVLYNDE